MKSEQFIVYVGAPANREAIPDTHGAAATARPGAPTCSMNRIIVGNADQIPLLLSMMAADFDDGLLLLDPTGQLAPLAADRIPPAIRAPFYFDATDKGHAPGFNVLNGVAQDERHLVVELIENTLAIIYPAGGTTLTRLRANDLLSATIERLLSEKNATLLDVLEAIKETAPDWDKKDREAAILDVRTRLRRLFRNPHLRAIISQPHSTFSLGKGVTIVNLDRRVLGDDAALFLGHLLIGRSTGTVYIHHLDFFAAEYLSSLFPQERFTVSTGSLPSERRFPLLRETLLGLGEQYVFRVNRRDAEDLDFHLANHQPLSELGPGEAYHQGGVIQPTAPPSYGRLGAIQRRSRARHSRRR